KLPKLLAGSNIPKQNPPSVKGGRRPRAGTWHSTAGEGDGEPLSVPAQGDVHVAGIVEGQDEHFLALGQVPHLDHDTLRVRPRDDDGTAAGIGSEHDLTGSEAGIVHGVVELEASELGVAEALPVVPLEAA